MCSRFVPGSVMFSLLLQNLPFSVQPLLRGSILGSDLSCGDPDKIFRSGRVACPRSVNLN
jgi:hypothetical protein